LRSASHCIGYCSSSSALDLGRSRHTGGKRSGAPILPSDQSRPSVTTGTIRAGYAWAIRNPWRREGFSRSPADGPVSRRERIIAQRGHEDALVGVGSAANAGEDLALGVRTLAANPQPAEIAFVDVPPEPA